MNLSGQLKLLAQGVYPDTGEVLAKDSLTNTPEVIRILFSLSDEIRHQEQAEKKTQKLSTEEKRQKNILEGKPPNSHFPWEEDEKSRLEADYNSGHNIGHLAKSFERSTLAIAIQLEKLSLISAEELATYR